MSCPAILQQRSADDRRAELHRNWAKRVDGYTYVPLNAKRKQAQLHHCKKQVSWRLLYYHTLLSTGMHHCSNSRYKGSDIVCIHPPPQNRLHFPCTWTIHKCLTRYLHTWPPINMFVQYILWYTRYFTTLWTVWTKDIYRQVVEVCLIKGELESMWRGNVCA